MIDVGRLVAAGIRPTTARRFVQPLQFALARFELADVLPQAMFLAQAAHESQAFESLEESLFYRTPERVRRMFSSRVRDLNQAAALCRNPRTLANTVYSDRLGNGPFASDDGWRFRGRGLFQLTGRFNYGRAAEGLQRPYVEQPELVAQPMDACLTAAWYFVDRGCHLLLDVDEVTAKINPAMAGADERRHWLDEFVRALQ